MDNRMHNPKVSHKLARLLDIPNEIIYDLPKLTMIGNVQLYIENHRGIIAYAPDKVRISSTIGEIIITGYSLVIKNISREEIHVEGEIFSLTYHR